MFQITELLLVFQFLQSSDGRLYCEDRSVLWVQAPPATVFMQEPQGQNPTARLLILVLPQKEKVYLASWLISNFSTIWLREVL